MKLNWKKKWLDDKSGYWYSAKVPILGWEYIVEHNNNDWRHDWRTGEQHSKEFEYNSYLFLSTKDADDIKLSKKALKTKEAAMSVCEKHLNDIAEKFNKWYKTK